MDAALKAIAMGEVGRRLQTMSTIIIIISAKVTEEPEQGGK